MMEPEDQAPEDDGKDENLVEEPAPPVIPRRDDLDDAFDRWFLDHIRGSVLGRNTECWNHLQAVLPDLKSRVRRLL